MTLRTLLVLMLALICGNGIGGGAQQPPPVTPSSIRDTAVTAALARVEQELADLRAKVAHPPKDWWDKLGTLSGLVSGVLVAVIGAYATWVYNRRQNAVEEAQRRREEAQKERELETLNIQTAERFLPYLAGANERQKEAALAVLMLLAKASSLEGWPWPFPDPVSSRPRPGSRTSRRSNSRTTSCRTSSRRSG